MFITFEGPEGSGKSTHAASLQQITSAIRTFEPGGTSLGQEIRKLLLHSTDMIDKAELLLFALDRAQHVTEVIAPALSSGRTVICDRYIDSTLAYQHYGRGISIEYIDWLNEFTTNGLEPDLTFILDIDPLVGFYRRHKEKLDRIEKAGIEFHNRVRNGYLQIARDNPDRCVVINADQSEDKVFEDIWAIFSARREDK